MDFFYFVKGEGGKFWSKLASEKVTAKTLRSSPSSPHPAIHYCCTVPTSHFFHIKHYINHINHSLSLSLSLSLSFWRKRVYLNTIKVNITSSIYMYIDSITSIGYANNLPVSFLYSHNQFHAIFFSSFLYLQYANNRRVLFGFCFF